MVSLMVDIGGETRRENTKNGFLLLLSLPFTLDFKRFETAAGGDRNLISFLSS